MPNKEEIRQNVIKWIEALRSGEYEQGRSSLHKEGSYCCLGVAVEVLHGADVWIEDYAPSGIHFYGHDRLSEILESNDINSLGLFVDDEYELINMNDKQCLTFSQIADWIEQNILSKLGA